MPPEPLEPGDPDAGRGGGRRGRWLAAGGVAGAVVAGFLVFGAVVAGILVFGSPSHGDPAHVLVTPARIGIYLSSAGLERQTGLTELRDETVKMTAGQVSQVVSAVYESGSATQIILFIGGHLADAEPAVSVATFRQRFHGAAVVSAGSLGGQAACAESGAGTSDVVALCTWSDNDSFGELVSPTMNSTALAQVMLAFRPHLEIPATGLGSGQRQASASPMRGSCRVRRQARVRRPGHGRRRGPRGVRAAGPVARRTARHTRLSQRKARGWA